MKKYYLDEKAYITLKTLDFSKLDIDYYIADKEKCIATDNLRDLLVFINENIVSYGLSEQEECSDYGKRLYYLYDYIYYQK